MDSPVGRLTWVAALVAGVLAGSAVTATAAPTRVPLTADVVMPGVPADGHVKGTRLIAMTTPLLDRPRVVTATVRFGYVITPESRNWRRPVLVGIRITCSYRAAHVTWQSPFTTRNWVWTAPGPADDALTAGPDVTLQTKLLIPGGLGHKGRRARCAVHAHDGAKTTARGRAQIVVKGAPSHSPTRLTVSDQVSRGALEWREPNDNRYISPGKSSYVLRRSVAVPSHATKLRFESGLELTTCNTNTSSCEEDAPDARGGTTVVTQAVATPLAGTTPCGPAQRSQERVSFVSTPAHHLKLALPVTFDRVGSGDCGRRYAFKLLVRVLDGNPVRIHGRRYTNAILIPT